jgi:hypothetical protein
VEGDAPCLLGKTWGYDDHGIWVSDGCGGEFVAGRQAAPGGPPEQEGQADAPPKEAKRKSPDYIPNRGFRLYEGELGQIYLRLFTYVRYLNQMGLDASYTDSFGNARRVQRRQDVQLNKFFLPADRRRVLPRLVHQRLLAQGPDRCRAQLHGHAGQQPEQPRRQRRPARQRAQVDYDMTSLDGGLKYRGFSLEAELYWRWLGDCSGPNTDGIADIHDHGFQVQTSAMVLPSMLQAYVGGSAIRGRYGDGSEIRAGGNFFPFKKREIEVNAEWLHPSDCPVGYTSVPYPVGGNGDVFHTNIVMTF